MDRVYGEKSAARIAEANVLVVGAGGVGCELLKDLGISGFRHLTLVDLDTIDVSNLNRQFLFRREHVGESKAKTAATAVEKMLKGRCKVEAIVGNIKDPQFDTKFFSKFDVVLNALDNTEARRHVNRMCLAAKVPMVESGSTGYLGQVTVVVGGETECYDCLPKPAPKTYAVCTIRSTPEKPVHCIVWAKQLMELLFGAEDESNLLLDLDKVEDETGRLRWDGTEAAGVFAARVVRRVFWDDVEKQRAVASEAWKSRAPPEPVDVLKLASKFSSETNTVDLLEHRLWSEEENASILMHTLERIVTKRADEVGSMSFDKDDDDLLAFVTTAANLRAKAYGVEQSSAFRVKGIAGNIIHAIATTNAVVAALIVLETLKIVTCSPDDSVAKSCLTTYVQKLPTTSRRRRLLLQPESLQKPNKTCYVCSNGQLQLEIDTRKRSLDFLVNKVLRDNLGMIDPCVFLSIGNHHNTLFESGDDLDEDELAMYRANAKKTLEELKVLQGAILEINDFSQNLKMSLHVSHAVDVSADDNPAGFSIRGKVPEAAEPASVDDEEVETDTVTDSRKRRREEDDVVHIPATKKREGEKADDTIIIL